MTTLKNIRKRGRSRSPLRHSRKALAGIHPWALSPSPITKMDTRHKPRV